jgi:hypothetical protein
MLYIPWFWCWTITLPLPLSLYKTFCRICSCLNCICPTFFQGLWWNSFHNLSSKYWESPYNVSAFKRTSSFLSDIILHGLWPLADSELILKDEYFKNFVSLLLTAVSSSQYRSSWDLCSVIFISDQVDLLHATLRTANVLRVRMFPRGRAI